MPFALLLPVMSLDLADVIFGYGAAEQNVQDFATALALFAPGLVFLRRRRDPEFVLREGTEPVASSSATRVSPRSTLTNTCFFNCHSVLWKMSAPVSSRVTALSTQGKALLRN